MFAGKKSFSILISFLFLLVPFSSQKRFASKHFPSGFYFHFTFFYSFIEDCKTALLGVNRVSKFSFLIFSSHGAFLVFFCKDNTQGNCLAVQFSLNDLKGNVSSECHCLKSVSSRFHSGFLRYVSLSSLCTFVPDIFPFTLPMATQLRLSCVLCNLKRRGGKFLHPQQMIGS